MIEFLIVIVLIVLLTYKQIISVYRPISYEDTMLIATEPAHDKPPTTIQIIKINSSTKRAFLPYEKIRFSVKYLVVSEEMIKWINNEEINFVILGDNVTLTKSKINNKFQTEKKGNKDKSNNVFKFMSEEKDAPASVLKATSNENEYYTEMEVIFTKPGIYNPSFYYKNTQVMNPIHYKIEIGSTIDVMNKRTNDLLYILTVVIILLTIYGQFASDLRGFFVNNKSEKPTSNSYDSPKKDTIGHVFKVFKK